MGTESMLESSATVERATIGRDSSSGVTQTWAALTNATNIPCSVQEVRGSVSMRYAQREIVVDATIVFLEEWFGEVNDRIHVVDDAGNDLYYLVKGRSRPLRVRDAGFAADCELIRGPVTPAAQPPGGQV